MKQLFADADELVDIERSCWRQLGQATADKKSGWRLPVLATIAQDGSCQQRTVVLRQVDSGRQTLLLHTDVRSHKVQQIQQDARISLLFYDHEAGVQLSARCKASLHTDDRIADEIWDAQPPLSLKCYFAQTAPGTVTEQCDANLPDRWIDAVPLRSDLRAARPNFCVIQAVVFSLEFLLLDRRGHRRAEFEYKNPSVTHRRWLMP